MGEHKLPRVIKGPKPLRQTALWQGLRRGIGHLRLQAQIEEAQRLEREAQEVQVEHRPILAGISIGG